MGGCSVIENNRHTRDAVVYVKEGWKKQEEKKCVSVQSIDTHLCAMRVCNDVTVNILRVCEWRQSPTDVITDIDVRRSVCILTALLPCVYQTPAPFENGLFEFRFLCPGTDFHAFFLRFLLSDPLKRQYRKQRFGKTLSILSVHYWEFPFLDKKKTGKKQFKPD